MVQVSRGRGQGKRGRWRAGGAGLSQELRGAGRACEGEQRQGDGKRGRGCCGAGLLPTSCRQEDTVTLDCPQGPELRELPAAGRVLVRSGVCRGSGVGVLARRC